MDTRETLEQAELRRAARQLARDLGPATVADLDDVARVTRLTGAVRDAGWLELRHDTGDGAPLASGVEAAIVSEALAEAATDVAFTGPVLAADLLRRAGVEAAGRALIAFSPALVDAARVTGPVTTTPLYAVDGGGEDPGSAYLLVPEGSGARLGQVPLGEAAPLRVGADLTRMVHEIAPGTSVRVVDDQARLLDHDDLAAWSALGLALTSADLVGAMRGVLDLTVAYAAERRQYGVPIGSFQAVQHLLAEACCLMEGSVSAALYAAWAVDDLAPGEARTAGRVAKAYCSRAARTICETAVQVHGGIGNTWECIVHVYLRRALLSSRWFGDDGVQLDELACERLGAAHGLS